MADETPGGPEDPGQRISVGSITVSTQTGIEDLSFTSVFWGH